MNHLGHLYFAERDDGHRLGSLAADWFKGRLEHKDLPPRITAGIRRHRFIDGFADQHPAALAARRAFAPSRRRGGGIILDMVNDHFLIRHWDTYAATSLGSFRASAYDSLERTRPWWPRQGQEVIGRLIREDWIARYADLATVAAILEGIGRRMRRDPGLADPLALLERHERLLEEAFHALMADLRERLHHDGANG